MLWGGEGGGFNKAYIGNCRQTRSVLLLSGQNISYHTATSFTSSLHQISDTLAVCGALCSVLVLWLNWLTN
jgi:hypothetical protein